MLGLDVSSCHPDDRRRETGAGNTPRRCAPAAASPLKKTANNGGFCDGIRNRCFRPYTRTPDIRFGIARASCPLGPIPSPPSVGIGTAFKTRPSLPYRQIERRMAGSRRQPSAPSTPDHARKEAGPMLRHATPSAWLAQDDRQGATAQLRAIIVTRT